MILVFHKTFKTFYVGKIKAVNYVKGSTLLGVG